MKKSPATTTMEKKDIRITKPPNLFKHTQAKIKEIEAELGGTFLVYWSAGIGMITHSDVPPLAEVLKHVGDHEKVYLFLKSNGGDGQSALRMVNLLRQHGKRLTALIPLECASAATMISLGADEVQMGPLAYLTAVDTSLTHDLSPVDRNNYLISVSQDELNRVTNLWHEADSELKDPKAQSNPYAKLYEHIHPLVFGAIDRASSLSLKICEEILSYHVKDPKERARISRILNADYPSHSYPITLREAQRIGLKVKAMDEALNDQLFEINAIYSEMGQRALTDFDELNYHDHEVQTIIEGRGIQFTYQNDKDWHYRQEERRWIPLNDMSCWNRYIAVGAKSKSSTFHVR
ncbi:MAG: hypothetical protein ACI8T1_000545 [Verrucomicrobiales bacterium]